MASLSELQRGPLVLAPAQRLRLYHTSVSGLGDVHELVVVTPALGQWVPDERSVCGCTVPDAPRWVDAPDLGPGDSIGPVTREEAEVEGQPLCILCWWATRWVVWRQPVRAERPRHPIAGPPGLLFAPRQLVLPC